MTAGKAWGYALDPATTPKSIDLVSASGMALRGIYDLSGDRMEICAGLQRPQSLAAGPEGKTILVALRRAAAGARPRNTLSSSSMNELAARLVHPQPLRPLVIDVDRDGFARVAGVCFIQNDGLQSLAGLLLGDNPRRQVRLRCDADLPFSRVADLLAVLRTAGMARSSVLLATAPTPTARLEFCIAPVRQVSNLSPSTPGKEGKTTFLTAAQVKLCQEDLQAHGPTFGRTPQESGRMATEYQNAIADLIGLLEGIEKASVIMQPADMSPSPPTLYAIAVQTRAGGPPTAELIDQVRGVMAAVAPGGEVKVVEMTGAVAADAKVNESNRDHLDKGNPRSHVPELDNGVETAEPRPSQAQGRATPSDEPRCAWFELAAEAPSSLITATCQGRKQVLLMVRPDDAMAAGDEGPLRWRIADVAIGKTAGDRPTLQVTLDDAGARRIAALSEAHRGDYLAVVIDGRVVSLRKIEAKMAAQIEIDGNFDAHRAERLLHGLLGPFAGGGEDPSSASDEEEEDTLPPLSGGGMF
jgi:biopolymer transport protein ExbD